MNLVVRQARPSDLRTIASFNCALALESERLRLAPARVLRGVRRLLNDPSRGFYLVAESDGQLIGQLMVTPEWSDWRDGEFWWLQSVYVLPEWRGRGVFGKLHQEILKRARRSKSVCVIRLYVDRSNRLAQKTYRRLGMTPSHYQMMEQPVRRRTG